MLCIHRWYDLAEDRRERRAVYNVLPPPERVCVPLPAPCAECSRLFSRRCCLVTNASVSAENLYRNRDLADIVLPASARSAVPKIGGTQVSHLPDALPTSSQAPCRIMMSAIAAHPTSPTPRVRIALLSCKVHCGACAWCCRSTHGFKIHSYQRWLCRAANCTLSLTSLSADCRLSSFAVARPSILSA